MAIKPNKQLPSSFVQMGAEVFTPPTIKRIILTLDGEPNTGKTDIMLQAPDPLIVFSFDKGLDGVIQKYQKKRVIGVFNYDMPHIDDQELFIHVWNKFHADFYKALENPEVRSFGLDKGGNVYDTLRMALLGGYTKIPQLSYTRVNMLYEQLFRAIKNTNKNLIVTHELEKDYSTETKDDGKKVSTWNGGMRRSGYQKLDFLIDGSVTCLREKRTKDFSVRVDDCKRNINIVGDVLEDEDCSFQGIVEAIYGEPMDPEEWGM